jgi:hypothetical protein
MAMHDPDPLLDPYLKGDTPLSRGYRAGAREQPPAPLDAVIAAQARRAVGSRPRALWSPFGRHWLVPASAAAVLVVSVGVALLLSRDGVLEPVPQAELRAPATEPPATARAPAEVAEVVRPSAPAKAEAVASVPASAAAPAAAEERADTARDLSHERLAAEAARAKRAPAALAKAAAPRTGADVIAVVASGAAGAYQLAVTIRSPDQGCQQYADWWEVVSEDGRLLYRRVLLHSHRDEQPFTRSGGPVPIAPDTVVWVRAHMHPAGYGGQALHGSVRNGFQPAAPPAGFAAELVGQGPRPEGCDF